MKPPINLFKVYLQDLFHYAGLRAWFYLALLVVLGMTQGVGLFMLIPFMHVLGLGGGEESQGLADSIGNILHWFGLPVTLPVILCIFVGIVLTHAAATRAHEIICAKIVHGFACMLRERLYQAISRMEWSCFVRAKPAEITHVLVGEIQRVIQASQQLLQLLGNTAIVLIHIIVALMVSVGMTLMASLCGLILFFLLWPYNRKIQRVGRNLQDALRALYEAVAEHLGGMKLVKSYGLEDRHARKAGTIAHQIAETFIRFIRFTASSAMYYQVGAALVLSLFFYLAVEVVNMPAPDLLLLIFLFGRILPKFTILQRCFQGVSHGLPAYEAAIRMRKRFEEAAERWDRVMPRPMERPEGDIELRGLWFRYDQSSENDILRDINLTIPACSMTAIIGPSGSGKSTLADMIMGLLTPNKGTLLVGGRPLTGDRIHAWRRLVGYVPQETFLFHESIRANLLWAREEADEDDLWRVLEMAAAKDFVTLLPQGLDTLVGDRGVRLSGGERQRIALARALLRRPSLLLLDEATSNLDRENEARIQEAVERLHGNLTILVIAHRYSTIKRADKIVVLEEGQIVKTGTWEELKNLLNSQEAI